MSDLRVSVYDSNNAFIAHVPRHRGVQWQDELNTPGSGQMQVHLDDQVLVDHPTLLNDFNIVRFYRSGTAVKAWIIEGKDRALAADGSDRWLTVSGRGVLSLLSNAVVYPEYGLKANSADDRSFDYGSKESGWYVASDWVTPVGVRQDSSTVRKGYPVGWGDGAAQWLWSSNPDAASAPGRNYFRGSFTVGSTTRVRIYVAGDDLLSLQLDGEEVLFLGPGKWHTTSSYTATVTAGTHIIAACVTNAAYNGTNNPAGFLCTVAQVDRNNKVVGILKRSQPGAFKVRGYGSPPGWFSASILKTLVDEARTRGVRGFSAISYGFTDTTDTAGAAWTGRMDRSFRVGTTDLLDLASQLSEHDMDVDMSPALQLQAWKKRGADLSATVRLLPGRDLLDGQATSVSAKVRGRALVRHKGGWVEIADSTSESAYGRREAGLVIGSAGSDSQAQATAQAALTDLAAPEVTVPLTVSSASGQQPYTDFGLGDVVTAPGILGTLGKHRVMSIAGTEADDTGVLTYALELYPEG